MACVPNLTVLELMTGACHKSDVFDDCGPRHLKNIDWSMTDHRRSVAASLIKGVKVMERDRQQRRIGLNALAPAWWEFFHFHLTETLLDEKDKSAFGAIFEYKPPTNSNQHYHRQPQRMAPRYVLAFRGTVMKWLTLGQDIYNDLKLYFNELKNTTRYEISLNAVQALFAKLGSLENVWLTGYSLGAGIALQVGKTIAREGHYIETYLFNPPFPSVPVEKLSNPDLKRGMRVIKSVTTAGLFFVVKGIRNSKQECDPFAKLRPWIPYLFVNPKDGLSCEYIGHFENRGTMEALCMGYAQKIADQVSIKSLIKGSFGGESEALHLIPAAFIVKNMYPMKDEFRVVHGINQWWASHTQWQTQRFE